MKQTILFNISNKLKELRLEKKLTQRTIAKILGIAQPSYIKYEQAKNEPDIDTICTICDYFDISADYLLGRENEFGEKTKNSKIEQNNLNIRTNNGTINYNNNHNGK